MNQMIEEQRLVHVDAGPVTLEGNLAIPEDAQGILLAERVVGATDWLLGQSDTQGLAVYRNIGYFGSSTGAAAALIAATEQPEAVQAVVSRGGRPDLAQVVLVMLIENIFPPIPSEVVMPLTVFSP